LVRERYRTAARLVCFSTRLSASSRRGSSRTFINAVGGPPPSAPNLFHRSNSPVQRSSGAQKASRTDSPCGIAWCDRRLTLSASIFRSRGSSSMGLALCDRRSKSRKTGRSVGKACGDPERVPRLRKVAQAGHEQKIEEFGRHRRDPARDSHMIRSYCTCIVPGRV